MLGSNTLKETLTFFRISCLANDEEDKIILLILNIPLLFMPKNYSTFCQIIC